MDSKNEEKDSFKEPESIMVFRTSSEKTNENTFAFDSYAVSDADMEKIKEAVKKYNNESLTGVRVEGHADDAGALEYNQKLSEKRAQAVADILISEGMALEKILVKGFGKEKSIADNAEEDGAAKNRRVEIYADMQKEVEK